MSDTITIGSASTTIYGSYADAVDYVTLMFGAQYTAWLALGVEDRGRSLVAATRYLDAQVWNDDADTFVERDALAVDGVDVFAVASYELAVLIAADPSLTSNLSAGSNIQSVSAGGAGVSYFAPATVEAGTATKLPTIVQRLIGAYLGTGSVSVIGGFGNAGDCESPFSECEDYDRGEPY